jgi:hypothetical protein
MLRISALIAALALIATTANVSAAQPQTTSGKKCSFSDCVAACAKDNRKFCDRYCERMRSTGTGCYTN